MTIPEDQKNARWKRQDASINQADGYALQADLLAYKGRYEEAIQFYNRALQLDPKNADLWAFLGITLEGGLGRAEEARKCWEKAISLDSAISQAFRAEEPAPILESRKGIPLPCGLQKTCRARLRDLMDAGPSNDE